MATIYVVATPIGNLEDITLRALKILKEVDFVLAEDTRVTKKLLDHFQIKKPIISYHQHSRIQKIDQIIGFLKEQKNLALVSDAGTPGISDPGNLLIKELRQRLGAEVNVIPIPGPSALIAAASVSGISMHKFLFLGFPPSKRKRKKFFQEVVYSKYPVIFYESSHRIIKTLNELNKVQAPEKMSEHLQLLVFRELTKKFETMYQGTIEEVIRKVEENNSKGEFVVIINKTDS